MANFARSSAIVIGHVRSVLFSDEKALGEQYKIRIVSERKR